jgi:alpha-L-fucosidase
MADLMRQQAQGPQYARYATAQWTELIDTYQPSVLWNDMGWPAESDPQQLFGHYYDTVADGVVNDRWTQVRLPANRLVRELYLRFVSLTLKALARAGRSLPKQPQRVHSDFHTHEYATPDPAPTAAWELTRGLGRSFGYNAKETAADTLTGTQLIHLLADVVAHGGNLLINVGPDGAGHIPDLQQRPLRELGAWLDRNGDAIYATRPWSTAADGHQVRYTQNDSTVFAIVLADHLTSTLTIRDLTLPPGSRVGVLNGPTDLAWIQAVKDVRITPPPRPPGQHAHVLTITTS